MRLQKVDYVAVRCDDGDRLVITDCASLAASKKACPLPTAAASIVRYRWGPIFAPDQWELSAGMEAAVKRIGAILAADADGADVAPVEGPELTDGSDLADD
jgi:hypothetical protein